MNRRVLLALALGVATLLIAQAALAERPGGTFPVIVVFRDDAPFHAFRGFFHADDRARANPAAWDYLDHGVAGLAQLLESRLGFRAEHVFSAAIRGFSGQLTTRQIDALEQDPFVAYVEPDGVMIANDQTLPWGIDRIDADVSSTLAGNGSGAVTNVNVYIIDTGIWSHPDLYRINHVNFAGGQNTDCHGHGTHVAGTVAAKDNTSDVVGVAPGAPLTGVKVLGCGGTGTTSGVIKGVDWVTKNAVMPAVANMSLGGGASTALDDAVKRSADSGVFYALAAGNSGANACNSSPARAGSYAGVMTTAATDSSNKEASWSNYGPCVDIWAPGVSIPSTRKGGGTTTMSGTSMASPHVAGTAALYLSKTSASPAAVEDQLRLDAETGMNNGTVTTSKGGTEIKIVYAGGY